MDIILSFQIDDNLQTKHYSVCVFGPDLILSQEGNCIDVSSIKFTCVDSSVVGVPISLPLAIGPLCTVVETMKIILGQAQLCSWLTHFGFCCNPPHYSQLILKRGHCHIPVLLGESQTRKTTALQLALSLFGCNKKTFYSKGSKESFLQKCSQSTIPVECDNPVSPKAVGQLVVELFNGARVTMVKGDIRPLTGLIISENFNLSERAK